MATVPRANADLLLLHGFTHTGRSWEPVLDWLSQRYRGEPWLAPDLRGHGDASDRVPVSLPGIIDDLAAAAPPSFTLVGYSMGGRIALHVAFALQDRVRRLVLIGASPGIADPAQRAARRASDERLADELATMTIEQFAERWATGTPVLGGQPAEVRERAHADRLRNTPDGLARALRGLGTGALPSLWERLPEVTVPVALVVGERDDRFRAIAGEMAARLAHARVTVVAGAGHAVHLEAPDQVAAVIAGAP